MIIDDMSCALKAEDNSMVEAIDTEEVWLADKRVELVTRHIINNHDKLYQLPLMVVPTFC
jgi:hypothetical protein